MIHRAAPALAFVAALVALLCGTAAAGGRVIRIKLPIPAFTGTCADTVPAQGATSQIPMTVSALHGIREEIVPVCIGDHGPYPFIVDTGASISVVKSTLAKTLGLPRAGPPSVGNGIDCTATVTHDQTGTWSIGSVALAGQVAAGAPLVLPTTGPGEVDGLIGSDVLSRFAAVKFTFTTHELDLVGPEGAPLDGTPSAAQVAASATAAGALAGHDDHTTVKLDVLSNGHDVQARLRVRIGSHTRQLVLDTGAARSALTLPVARGASLATLSDKAAMTSIGCTTVVSLYKVSRWSVGTVALPADTVAGVSFPGGFTGVDGLLGSDVLGRFPWMVVNYAGGELLLGQRG